MLHFLRVLYGINCLDLLRISFLPNAHVPKVLRLDGLIAYSLSDVLIAKCLYVRGLFLACLNCRWTATELAEAVGLPVATLRRRIMLWVNQVHIFKDEKVEASVDFLAKIFGELLNKFPFWLKVAFFCHQMMNGNH